jgi:hypothetical protein
MPDRLRTRYHLELLREDAATAAIQRPFEAAGKTIDVPTARGLAGQLLQMRVQGELGGEAKAVRGEFVEPVQLQVVCQRLWMEMSSDETLITDQHIGRLGTLEDILAGFYEDGIRFAAARTRVPERAIRRAFEDHLITSDGTRGLIHRGREESAGIPNITLDMLEESRLVRSEWRAGARWYEIPHDSLIEPIRRANGVWRKLRQRRARRRVLWVLASLSAVTILSISLLTVTLLKPSVEPTDMGSWISEITIESVAPLGISFRFSNLGSLRLASVDGVATVKDRAGRVITTFATAPFSVEPGGSTRVEAASWWSSQQAGDYLLEILLNVGGHGSAARSFVFQIIPSQLPSGVSGSITAIEIGSVAPFVFSFRFANLGSVLLDSIVGMVTITNQLSQPMGTFSTASFSVSVGEVANIAAESPWDLQRVGIYTVNIWVSLYDYGLGSVSTSLAFRVLPIQLPLDPVRVAEGEGLYTVYQTPANWGLQRVSAPEAWRISHGESAIVVAVIDSGIDASIPQLSESMWVNDDEIPENGVDDDQNGYIDDVHGWDFRDNDNSSLVGSPIHSHGTFVAGIIAARPGELPVVGVAPGVKLMDIRFLDSSNEFRTSDWGMFSRAIDYAVDNGARIINLGIFANGRPPGSFEAALKRAAERGVIIIGCTGNTGENKVLYPGKYDTVYAVGATTKDDLLAEFSNQGSEVAFCAPGADVVSFLPGGRMGIESGTSVGAVPHVTGVLALILSVAPELSPADAIGILRDSAIDLGPRGFDTSFGYGLVNAHRALSSLVDTRPGDG